MISQIRILLEISTDHVRSNKINRIPPRFGRNGVLKQFLSSPVNTTEEEYYYFYEFYQDTIYCYSPWTEELEHVFHQEIVTDEMIYLTDIETGEVYRN